MRRRSRRWVTWNKNRNRANLIREKNRGSLSERIKAIHERRNFIRDDYINRFYPFNWNRLEKIAYRLRPPTSIFRHS